MNQSIVKKSINYDFTSASLGSSEENSNTRKITQISCSDAANNDNDWNELYSNDCEDIIFSPKKSTAYDHIATTDLMFSYSLPNLECCLNPSSSGIVSCPSIVDQNNCIPWNFT
ncbi:unnamed protein product [Adineta ricciae]|uniref:Uncharacterized protein n=1 Tax=Adineta ricciae TaxID=249248 RepID=A0A813RVW7_ADIRI|nr:unnamed protein product [Adineta ricciae]CAF1122617.1 unnamed protein product [Adineta ricciae]